MTDKMNQVDEKEVKEEVMKSADEKDVNTAETKAIEDEALDGVIGGMRPTASRECQVQKMCTKGLS